METNVNETTVPTSNQPQPMIVIEAEEPAYEDVADRAETRRSRGLRSLYRNPNNKVVAGVCGGTGDMPGIDPTLVRLGWIVMTLFTGGGGFWAYLVLWAMLPVGTQAQGRMRPAAIELKDKSLARTAYLLMGLGVLWLLSNAGILPQLFSTFSSVAVRIFWPALLIGAGYLLLRSSGRNWRKDVNAVRGNVRSAVNESSPARNEVRDGVASLRRNMPLHRSADNRVVLGVCGGIGERLGVDANLVRLIWTVVTIGTMGLGIPVYVVAGVLLPGEQPVAPTSAAAEPQEVIIVDGSVS